MSLTALELGIAGHPTVEETVSGDRHVLCEFPGGVLLGLLDGLGHGPGAAEASRLASDTLLEHAQESLVSLISRCHERLRPARGVVMSLASFLYGEGLMSWAGIGNVEGILVRGKNGSSQGEEETLLVRPGVVGIRVRFLEAELLHVHAGDTLVFATDGVRSGFAPRVARSLPTQKIAEQILLHHSKGTDDALVMVARCRGGA